METTYIIAIICLTLLGLVVAYIIFRKAVYGGYIPILSDVVDPIIFGSKNKIFHQKEDY